MFFTFLSILITYFSFRTVEIMYFSIFSAKPVNCPLNLFTSSFEMKDNHSLDQLRKTIGNSLGILYFQITYTMCSTSISTCIMTKFSNFMIFFITNMFMLNFFNNYNKCLHFQIIPTDLLLITTFFLLKNNLSPLHVLLSIHAVFPIFICTHHVYFIF